MENIMNFEHDYKDSVRTVKLEQITVQLATFCLPLTQWLRTAKPQDKNLWTDQAKDKVTTKLKAAMMKRTTLFPDQEVKDSTVLTRFCHSLSN